MAPDQESSASQIEKPPVDSVAFEPPDTNNNCSTNNSPIKQLPNLQNGVSEIQNGSSEPIDNETYPSDVQISLPSQVRLEWIQVQKVGAGLANLGNTCFLNTVIQCLTYCPPLTNYLMLADHGEVCKCYEFCMMCELQKHIKDALQHSGDVIEPVHIYENLKFIADHFQCGQQEDAHEFLRFVIENLWRSSLYSYNDYDSMDPTIRETTIINRIFGGYNRSQVICLRCHKKSSKYEHFMDFILDIKHNANTLEKALEQFVKPELLENDNAYKCPQCDKLVRAEKTSTIHKAPNVATIQLKRFDYSKSHGGKINKHVSYPERLDLRPFMTEKMDIPLMYRLNAVLVHVGQNCNSGHYYCYIRNSNGQWYLMDDARVQKAGIQDVLNQQAYVLFYVRVPPSNGLKKNGISPFPIQTKNAKLGENGKILSPKGMRGSPNHSYKGKRNSYSNYADNRSFNTFPNNRVKFHWNRNQGRKSGPGRMEHTKYNSSGASSQESSERSNSESSEPRGSDSDYLTNKENFRGRSVSHERTNSHNGYNPNCANGDHSAGVYNGSMSPHVNLHQNSNSFYSRDHCDRDSYDNYHYGRNMDQRDSYSYSNGYYQPESKYRSIHHNSSDLKLNYNHKDMNRSTPLVPHTQPEYCWNNNSSRNYNQYYHSENAPSRNNWFNQERRYSQGYNNQWNRNSPRFNNSRQYYENDKRNYRKFHNKSKSADSYSFGPTRFNPYNRYNKGKCF